VIVPLISLLVLVSAPFVFLPAEPCRADSWQNTVAIIQQELQQTEEDVNFTRELIKREKNKINGDLESLQKAVSIEETRLAELQAKFDQSLQTQESMNSQIETEKLEIQSLEEIFRTIVKDAEAMDRASIISPEIPSRSENLQSLLDSKHFPGIEDFQFLIGAFFQEMEASAQIRKQEGKYIDAEGKSADGDILRIGKFTALFQTANDTGYLRYDPKRRQLAAIQGSLPWSSRRDLQSYFAGHSDHLPLDLSAGAIFEHSGGQRGVWEWLRAGGFLVWPIIMVGSVAVALIIERLIYLGRVKANSNAFMLKLQALTDKEQWQEAKTLCSSQTSTPTCKVLETALDHVGTTRDVIENAIQEAILRELPRLERFLPTLSVLAAVAPLLGLLGTVTGMINTFQVITLVGTGDSRMMSGGISEALITTQLGLAVAIPIIIVHNFLERRVDKVIGDMEEKSVALSVILLKQQKAAHG